MSIKRSTVVFVQIVLFVCAWGVASAQDYLITSRGDSLVGEFRPLFWGTDKKVQLISDNKKKTTFSLFQVREFSTGGDVYHPVKNDEGYAFMKLLKPGYLSLYAYQLPNQTRFDGLFLKKMDGDYLAVPNLGFKKYMSRFLEDCPTVVAMLEEGDLDKKNIEAIVDTYNECVRTRTFDSDKSIVISEERVTKDGVWSSLEEKVKAADFSAKNDALEMIAEIRKKIMRGENIPNFMIEGLKSSLRDTGLSEDLNKALEQLN